MAQIGGERRQESLYIGALAVPLRESVNGKGVPQIVDARLVATGILSADAGELAQPPETLSHHLISNRFSESALKNRLIAPVEPSGLGKVVP